MVLLRVSGLRVGFPSPHGFIPVVGPLDLTIAPGERVALVGESGSGKTLTALTIAGLERMVGARRTAGTITLGDTELTRLDGRGWRRVRGRRIGFVFQDPLSSLNPLLTVGEQIVEALLAHQRMARREALARAEELLASVGIDRPAERLRQYPFEFSGGMRQRVMLAIAIANHPQLLIADEPTTALDVTVQAGIIRLIQRLSDQLGIALMIITHDLGLVAHIAQRVVVMYAGELVEDAPVGEFYRRQLHPYPELLLGSVPRLDTPRRTLPRSIPGSPPQAGSYPSGCRFHPRCPLAEEECRQRSPGWTEISGRRFRCLVRERELARRTTPGEEFPAG